MIPALRRRATDVDHPLGMFRRDMDLLSHDLSRALWGMMPKEFGGEGLTVAYPVDISEKDGQILVDAEMPGFSKNEIDVTVENGILKISAERKEEKTTGKKHHLHERHYARVERQLALPCEVDDAKAMTKFENGVLHLTMPKVSETRGRKIKVS